MGEDRQQTLMEQYYRRQVRPNGSDKWDYDLCADSLYRLLASWLPKSKDAVCIDLGCGPGRMLYVLQRLGMRNLTGVDLCEAELHLAGQVVKAQLVHKDVLAFLRDLPDESVDFISAMNFLEHLDKDTLLATLKQCRRVLKAGGALVGLVPNATSPFGGATRYWDIAHQQSFTTSSLRQVGALAGFDADRTEFIEWGPRAHGLKSAVRVLLWKIIRLFIAVYLQIECRSLRGGIYTADMAFRMSVPGESDRPTT